MGRWQEAETALTEAIRAFELGHRGLRIHALIKLADLRICQGRYEEAALLLAGMEDQSAARVPLAHLHLGRGEARLAKAVLEPALQSDTLDRLPALLLLVEVLLSLDEIDSAGEIVGQLQSLAQQSASPLLSAQAALAKARLCLATGNLSAGTESLNSALAHLQPYQQSLLAGRVRLEMARSLIDSDRQGAIVWARAALASFERIGAAHDAAEAAALLRQLGVGSGGGPRLQQALTRRESEILGLLGLGLSNRDIAERLVISPKTVEHHVSRILGKLKLRSRAEAAVYALNPEK
jgi:DNA-binding NarL/FixJ family response regulator